MPVLVKHAIKPFKTTPVKQLTFAKPTISASIVKEMQPQMIIKGRQAMSTYEWHIAQALDKNQIAYDYQIPYGGGSLTHGGIILDFLAYTNVEWAIDVRGSYWHRGDDINFYAAMHRYNSNAIIIIARDQDCQSMGTAESFLRKNGVI